MLLKNEKEHISMKAQISQHFNQASNKILSVDELLAKTQSPSDTEQVRSFERGFVIGLVQQGFKDGAGHFYVEEKKVQEGFSRFAGMASDNKAFLASLRIDFTQLQQAMDSCEDHAPRVQSGALKAVSF